MNRLKKWFGKKWQKIKHSKLFLAIIMLTIGITYTYCYLTIKYEYRDVFNSRVMIFNNSSVAMASSASENAGANQEVEEVAELKPKKKTKKK